jgi:hypothetical protein
MNYRIIPVTAFSQNCSLIWCEQTRLARWSIPAVMLSESNRKSQAAA